MSPFGLQMVGKVGLCWPPQSYSQSAGPIRFGCGQYQVYDKNIAHFQINHYVWYLFLV